jgi:hypothetical protein
MAKTIFGRVLFLFGDWPLTEWESEKMNYNLPRRFGAMR